MPISQMTPLTLRTHQRRAASIRSRTNRLVSSLLVSALLVVMMLALPAHLRADTDDSITLIKDGRPEACIIVPAAAGRERELARELNAYLEKATGTTLPVVDDAEATTSPTQIHVGETAWTRAHGPSLEGLGRDGFYIDASDKTRILLRSPSEDGLAFAADEFLERFLGVRWLFPGELGTHVPTRKDVTVPAARIREEPVYTSRLLSSAELQKGSPTEPIVQWARKLRMNPRVRFHHNLNKLFPPEQYILSHPDFFPTVDGVQLKPGPRSYNWQPDLRAKGIVEEAVAQINRYFEEHPEEESFSLGMNDSGVWGVSSDNLNSLGFFDLSDYYFGWANRVATGVNASHPDKLFGLLAYRELTDPPSSEIGVNPNVVPFICVDRMTWANPDRAREDQARTQQWEAIASHLGWYDYAYGGRYYEVPRLYMHLMAEYLRFGAQHRVRSYYGEIYPADSWAEGPKFYVLLKLLWNPEADVDALIRDWCVAAVGEAAAGDLAQYYALWEKLWIERSPQTSWFRQGSQTSMYLPMQDNSYLEIVTPQDLQQAESLIQRVVVKAVDAPYRERAAFIADGFEKVSGNARWYLRLKQLAQRNDLRTSPIASFDFSEDDGRGQPVGWTGWQRDQSQGELRLDHAIGSGSPGALRIDASGSNGGPMLFMRTLDHEASDAIFRIRVRVRTAGLEDDAVVGVEVRWQDPNGGPLLPDKSRTTFFVEDIQETGDWQTLVGCVRVPEGRRAKMQLLLKTAGSNRGSVWFDDLSITRIDPEEPAR